MRNLKVILSGGGSGGHIFPAVAIANAIKNNHPSADILFVGALGKMEMERVPKAGYPIEGLWISGLQRKLTLRNLAFPLKLISSWWKSRGIISRFQPDVVVGTGGFASGPLLWVAAQKGIPTLIQEQNAYAGLTNKLLASKVDRICVAYPNMDRFFPKGKLLEMGNPVREEQLLAAKDQAEARKHFGLDPTRPVVLVTGGSLGARTLNDAIGAASEDFAGAPEVQVLWQCGKLYEAEFQSNVAAQLPQVKLQAFLDRMDYAYAAADVVICRAGALTIAELCLLGKPAILVPSPNVAEDHQTKNAQALVERDAALLIKDASAKNELVPAALALLADQDRREQLGNNARQMAHPGAAHQIAEAVVGLAEK